jgi:hypothetical protein
MVDRIIAKLHEIVTSVHRGSPVSSHLEVTQMLREAFDTVMEQPEPDESAQHSAGQIPAEQKAGDRRILQKEILRHLNIFGITPDSFGGSKKGIEKIKIPEKSDVDKKLKEEEEEVRDLTWLFEKEKGEGGS